MRNDSDTENNLRKIERLCEPRRGMCEMVHDQEPQLNNRVSPWLHTQQKMNNIGDGTNPVGTW